MTSPTGEQDFMEVAGQKIHMSSAITFINKLAECRDSGLPVVFQNPNEPLSAEESSPEQVQQLLEQAIDVVESWLEAKRQSPWHSDPAGTSGADTEDGGTEG